MAGWKNRNPAGPNFVPAYQASGIPFVTSSAVAEVTATPVRVQFPSVTRFVQVENISDAHLRIGFTKNGIEGKGAVISGSSGDQRKENDAVHKNYFILGPSGSTGRLELRCKELWFMRDRGVSAGFSLIAGVTAIRPQDFPPLTGSAGFRGVG